MVGGTSDRAEPGGWVSSRGGARPEGRNLPATDGAWRSRSEGAGGTLVRGERWAFGIQSPRLSHVHKPFIRPVAGGLVGADDSLVIVLDCLTSPSEPFRAPRKG